MKMNSKIHWFAMTRWLLMVAIVGVQSPLVLTAQDADSTKLPAKLRKELDDVVFPAMKDGEFDTFYDSFGPIVLKRKSDTVQAIEAYARKAGLDSPLDFLVDVKLMRLSLIHI